MGIEQAFLTLAAAASRFDTPLGVIVFHRPGFLGLLLLFPVWWLVIWPRVGGGVLFTRGDAARRIAGRWGLRSAVMLALPPLLRSLAMACLVLVLADPHRIEAFEEASLQGMGIGLVVDLSSSMLATDMEGGRSRIAVAREAAIRFAEERPLDELSLVGFAGQALTRVPPTTDADLIRHGVRSLEIQLVRDGTDISAALLTSVARLAASEREPRVVILLTDGAHNGTGVPPLTAARAAAALDVRVHAVSVLGPDAGTRAGGASGAVAPLGSGRVQADMRTVLQGIAEITGGRYFHASSGAALDSVYLEINRLEEPEEQFSEVEERHPERGWPLLFGLLFLGMDVLLRASRWRIIP